MSIDTLANAKSLVQTNQQRGVNCPCCGQFAKTYKRKFNSAMAVCLIELYKETNKTPLTQYFHVSQLFLSNKVFAKSMHGGNFATMKYWGVIEEMPKYPNNTTARTSGLWKLTELGKDFVTAKIKLPKYIFTYNNSLVSVSEELIDIQTALTLKFNYQEIMKG